MKQCKKRAEQPSRDYPEWIEGNTVRYMGGSIYIMCATDTLVNLTTGKSWSNSKRFGISSSRDWEEVDCCFTVLDEVK